MTDWLQITYQKYKVSLLMSVLQGEMLSMVFQALAFK